MYTVKATTGGTSVLLHDLDPNSLQKLASGSFEDEINVVPQMTFAVYPQNAAYSTLRPLLTEIEVYNTVLGRVEFEGYLRQQTGTMKRSGAIAAKWTADGFMGFLMETVQDYHVYEDTDVPDFLTALLDAHNAMTEPRKHIFLGQCDIHDTSSKTTAYRRTLEEIRALLVDRLGGEIRVRRTNGRLYLDYLSQYGKRSEVKIALAQSMQEIEVSTDPTHIITRLVPLGAQLNDETAERLTIASVNSGCIWIDDDDAFAAYGTYQCAVQMWDDVTLPENLLTRARAYLRQNNVRRRHYALTALDLSSIGLAVEGFTVGDSYKTENALMDIDDWLRCVRRHVDILDPVRSTMEIGARTETLTVQANRTYSYVTYEVPKIRSDVLTKAQDRATAMLGLAGDSFLEFNTDTGEILIMDSRDKDGETTRVWRYNANGWGVSHTGYAGPYTMAATFDDGFTADFITTGTLRSIEIVNGQTGAFHVDSSGNVTASSMTISGGTINNGNGTFTVSPDGTVSASAITITGGRINITTSDEYYDALDLNCAEKNGNFTPLQAQFRNTDTKTQTIMQAGGIWAFSDYTDHTKKRSVITADGITLVSDAGTVLTMGTADGSIHTAGNVRADGTVSAPTGRFDAIVYQQDSAWYDLAAMLTSINSKIQTLWDAVFNS